MQPNGFYFSMFKVQIVDIQPEKLNNQIMKSYLIALLYAIYINVSN